MDIKMPEGDGIEATRLVKAKCPECKVIMLTLYEEYFAEAIEAGAVGYLLKDIKRGELIRAVRAAHEGKVPLSALSGEFFNKFAAPTGDASRPRLSERELEILRLIANGETTKEIGTKLFLSEATIKRDVQHIFDKLDARNRSEAVAEAYKRGLV
jgi:DNA-binding NarL/FixJ family response regulator